MLTTVLSSDSTHWKSDGTKRVCFDIFKSYSDRTGDINNPMGSWRVTDENGVFIARADETPIFYWRGTKGQTLHARVYDHNRNYGMWVDYKF